MKLFKITITLLMIFISKVTYSQTYKIKNSNHTINSKELIAFNNGKTQIILIENSNLPVNSPNWLYYDKKTQKLFRFENGVFVETDKTKSENKIKDIEKSIKDVKKSVLEAEKSILEAEKIIKNLKTN